MVRMFAAVALLLPLAHAIPAASPAALAFAPRMNGPHQSAQLRGPTPALALQALRGGKPAPAPPAPAPRGSSMLVRVGIMLGMYAAMCVAENLIADKLLAHPSAPSFLSALVAPSHLLGGMVSASYGLVILVNVVGSSFMMVYLSFIPGAARRKYTELAKKKGDRDAEARYSAPKLYAEGFSQEAKEYNCAQRAHQQALETYANFVVCSVIGGVRQVQGLFRFRVFIVWVSPVDPGLLLV